MPKDMSFYPQQDHADSVLYMMYRRTINQEFAEHPVDFNVNGLRAGALVLGRALTSKDVIADLGSSSGQPIAQAMIETDTVAKLICIEPEESAAVAYRFLKQPYKSRIHGFIQAYGENLPLQDNALVGASLHNVIFRCQDPFAVLAELRRTVQPGGFIVMSSNAEGHAAYRHFIEHHVAVEVMRRSGVEFTAPKPPAEGWYVESLPAMISQIPDLQVLDELYDKQDSRTIITPGYRMETYVESIKYSAANTDIPPHLRSLWRDVVDEIVVPFLTESMVENDPEKPYFPDRLQRGMVVVRNDK